jgi:hypothetical protein
LKTKTISRIMLLALLPIVFAGCSISKTASPDPVGVGNNLTFTIKVNFDAGDPNFDIVRDNLPNSVRFVSATTDSGQCIPPADGSDTVQCLVFNPNSTSPSPAISEQAGTATVTIVVTPTECGTFTNTASTFGQTGPPPADSISADQMATLEQMAQGQTTADQLTADQLTADQLTADQLTADQLAAEQQGVPTIEDSASFTVVGCEQNQQQGAPAPITQSNEQQNQSGDSSQTFNVS